MSVKNYDPAKIVMVFAGVIIEGFADGTFVTAARDNPTFTKVTGADGEGARSKSNDKSGAITLTLLQTSTSNDLLSALAKLDEANGNGVGPFIMKDLNGLTLVEAASAWIQKPADQEYAREISNREWVLDTTELEIFGGGNSSIG